MISFWIYHCIIAGVTTSCNHRRHTTKTTTTTTKFSLYDSCGDRDIILFFSSIKSDETRESTFFVFNTNRWSLDLHLDWMPTYPCIRAGREGRLHQRLWLAIADAKRRFDQNEIYCKLWCIISSSLYIEPLPASLEYFHSRSATWDRGLGSSLVWTLTSNRPAVIDIEIAVLDLVFPIPGAAAFRRSVF